MILTPSGALLAQDEPQESAADADEIETISVDRELESGEEYDDVDDGPLEPPPSAKESDLEELRRSFDTYREALAAGSYDEADLLAKRMVELAIRLYGLDSQESARALTNLGLVQHKNQQYDSAILNFTSAIDIIERIEDRLNSDLINPLRGLAAAQLGSGRPDLARETYDRAVHVSHVNEGPHNLMQIEILEELAETYLAMDKRKEAVDIHQFIYNLEARNTDLKSEEILPALERQAELMHRLHLYDNERAMWRRMIAILEDTRGKQDLSLIRPLTGLGQSYLYVSEFDMEYYSQASTSNGDSYFKRALRIALDNPEATWQIQLKSLLAIGDYYTLSSRGHKAEDAYEEAWILLSADEADQEKLAQRAELLEEPRVLQEIHPPRYYNSKELEEGKPPPAEFQVGQITAKYRITNRGQTRDVEIVDADPSGLGDIEYALEREMRRLIHRPRVVDGLPVETTDQLYTHQFYYQPSDLPESEDEDADAEISEETVAAEERSAT